MKVHTSAGSERKKRFTDELGEHWQKQFNAFSGPKSTPYTSHSSGFRDASVELPPPPTDAAPPSGAFESEPPRHRQVATQPSERRQAGLSGSNSCAVSDTPIAAKTKCKEQMASWREQLAPSGTGRGVAEPAAQPSRSSAKNQDRAEAAEMLQHQRSLGDPLVSLPTEMKPTELFVFPRGPHCMRPALATHATAGDAAHRSSEHTTD